LSPNAVGYEPKQNDQYVSVKFHAAKVFTT